MNDVVLRVLVAVNAVGAAFVGYGAFVRFGDRSELLHWLALYVFSVIMPGLTTVSLVRVLGRQTVLPARKAKALAYLPVVVGTAAFITALQLVK